MARPRVFVSSTFLDLRHIRQGVEHFISGMGYEPVLFENGDIPFSHHGPLDESCYKEVESCQILVLVIGGRYGSPASSEIGDIAERDISDEVDFYNSVTRKEFETAFRKDIPVYVFVEKGVSAEYVTYKENRDNREIKYAHVDNVNIFRLLDFIYTRHRNNLTREFEHVEDITSWLRDQWAGLFSDLLRRSQDQASLQTMSQQLSEMNLVVGALKDYSERIIKQYDPKSGETIAKVNRRMVNSRQRAKLGKTVLGRLVDSVPGIEMDSLVKVVREANSVDDVVKTVDDWIPENVTYQFRHFDSEVNECRQALGLDDLDWQDTSDVQTAKGPVTLGRPTNSP